MAPVIPGFYYDYEKQRYFQVQPNHVAAHGPASRYSKAAVKREAEDQHEQKRRKMFEQRKGKTTIKRSKVLNDPLAGGCGVTRELGLNDTECTTNMMRAWAQGLESRKVLNFRHHHGGGSGTFVFDKAMGVLTYAMMLRGHEPDTRFFLRHVAPPSCDTEGGTWGDLSTMWGGPIFDSQVTSMEISPSRVLMTTTMGGRQAACIHLTKLIDPEEWNAHSQSPTTNASPGQNYDPPPYTSDVSTLIRSTTNTTFWSSSARPDDPTSDFAIATTHGTVIVTESQSSWSSDRLQTFKSEDSNEHRSSEVLAVDWLDRNILLNGCRDGTVRLWDVRTDGGASGTSWRVRHPACINHVRKMGDASRIVVAGLEGRMAVYDLRYTRTPNAAQGVTRPLVEFPGYRNRELTGLAVGFDVCGDLVAAGTEEGGAQVFDGASGREVMVGMGGALGKNLVGPARYLRFLEMEDGREGMRLFVGGVNGIEQWTW